MDSVPTVVRMAKWSLFLFCILAKDAVLLLL